MWTDCPHFHATVKPFSEPALDKMQLCSLLVTCLTIFYGIMRTHPMVDTASSTERSFQGYLLASCQIMVALLPLALCWQTDRSRMKQHSQLVAARLAALKEDITNRHLRQEMSRTSAAAKLSALGPEQLQRLLDLHDRQKRSCGTEAAARKRAMTAEQDEDTAELQQGSSTSADSRERTEFVDAPWSVR